MTPPPSDADREQAEALCAELGGKIAELDARAVELLSDLDRYVTAGRTDQVNRLQFLIRSASRERAEMMRLLIGMGHSYPCDHGPAR